MPITVVCTKCSAKLNAPDHAAGKKVKCPKAGCGAVVAVPAPLPLDFDDDEKAPPAPAPKRSSAVVANAPARAKPPAREESSPAAGNDPFKFDAGEDAPKPPRAKRKRADDDDEEQRPARNRRRPADDDEDEDEDRPRKTQRKKGQSSGLSPGIIAAIAGGVFLLLGGIGLAIYLLSGSSKDKDTASSGSGSGSGGGSSSISKAAVPTGWVEFKEAGTGFKAYFPAKPNGMNDGDEKVYMVIDGTINFLVVVKRQALLIDSNNRKQVVDEFIDKTFKEEMAGKILSRKDATLAGEPATEILAAAPGGEEKAPPAKGGNSKSKSGAKDNDPGRSIIRIVGKGNKVYVAGVFAKNGMPPEEKINAFFDNFEFVDDGKPLKPGDTSKPSDPVATNTPPKTSDPPSTNPNPSPSDPTPAPSTGGSDKPAMILKLVEQVGEVNKSSTEAMNKCTDSATAQDAAKTIKDNADRVKKIAGDLKAIGTLTEAEIKELKAKTPQGNQADTKAATEANKKVAALLLNKTKLNAAAKMELNAAMNVWRDATLDFGFTYAAFLLPMKK